MWGLVTSPAWRTYTTFLIDLLLKVATAPESPVLVILTMRADFMHRTAEHHGLARAISEQLVIVSPMNSDELRSAIQEPAHKAGGIFEPGLDEELIEQVEGQPGCLPLLQFTLFKLWEAARRSDELKQESVN